MLNVVKNMRKRARLTQTELADILCIKPSTVSKWETGASFPRAETLLRLAHLLHCTVDELLGSNASTDNTDKSA